MSASILPFTSTQGLSICPLFSIISWRWTGSLMMSRSSYGKSYLRRTARTPWLQPQVGFKYAITFGLFIVQISYYVATACAACQVSSACWNLSTDPLAVRHGDRPPGPWELEWDAR